ncbi:Gmad2 immunoglobulin-like domain-containing protein [Streptomyces vilmorinianum]|uniref:Gmad2 immunoglobulin-like domain-containing protein n=1 Tax=Streptomyces vilmorinianum TaxID=3051092 RepID=UPI0010FB88B1|nr:Gmad2 immunoglobulin-like domain-containing protein [Streptomyces vilmorinianum]
MSEARRTTRTGFRWIRSTTLAAVLILPLTLTACGNGDGGGGRATDGTPTPSPTTPAPTPGTTEPTKPPVPAPTTPSTPSTPSTPQPTPTPPPRPSPKQVRTAVYFLHGEQVSPAPRTVTAPATAAGALRALLAGPSAYERGHGRTTAIPVGTTLNSVAVRDGIATVDLSGRYDDGGGTLSMRARIAQVVFTATRSPSIDKVRFALDGKPVTSLGGEGIALNKPVGRADFEDLAPDVLVESPLIGDTIPTPVRVWGSANTFEATLRLKITDTSGTTVANIHATATSGSGTRGTFDVTIPYTATRSGPGLLTAYWDSPKDGRPVISDTIPLTVNR